MIIRQNSLSLGNIEDIRVGESVVTPVSIARNLGSWFDASMTMESHVTKHVVLLFIFCIISVA